MMHSTFFAASILIAGITMIIDQIINKQDCFNKEKEMKRKGLFVFLAVLLTLSIGCSVVFAQDAELAAGGDTLAKVQARGVLKCSTSSTLPGFGFLNADGTITGFDVDLCKAVAAATLGDATKFELRPTTGADRFPVLQSGEIDLGFNTTTHTISRDTALGFDFSLPYFYDGQGIMVRADSGIESIDDLDGKTVCAQSGTTTEKNISDAARRHGIELIVLVYTEMNQIRETYLAGRCDAYTTDQSELIGYSAIMENPDDHKILPDVVSKEPLAMYVRQGDDNWEDIMNWTFFCMIGAEELGITSQNVDEMLGSDDPQVLAMLGAEGDLGKALGLNNDWCYQAVKQVGNYGEVFNHNLGPDSPLKLERGLNGLWNAGGLLYAPPMR